MNPERMARLRRLSEELKSVAEAALGDEFIGWHVFYVVDDGAAVAAEEKGAVDVAHFGGFREAETEAFRLSVMTCAARLIDVARELYGTRAKGASSMRRARRRRGERLQ